MIVFGWGTGAKELGNGSLSTCENCNNTNPFVVVESSKKITVYWIPVAKWSKQYFYICPVCSRGFQIPSKKLAHRILSAAFRNSVEPDEKLLSDLKYASNTRSSAFNC